MVKQQNDSKYQYSSARIYLLGIAVSLIAIIIVGGMSVWGINAQAGLVEKLYRHPFTVSTNVLEADAGLVAMHRYMKDVVIARDPVALNTAIAEVSENEANVLSHLETAKQEFLGSKERFQNVIDAVIGWRTIRNEVIELSKQKQYSQAADITINKGADYVRYLNSEMFGLVEFARNKASEFVTQSRTQKTQIQLIQVTVFFAVSMLVVAVFTFMYRFIRQSETRLIDSEYRYRSVFDNIPLSLWDENYSSVYDRLSELRAAGVGDLRAYFKAHPSVAAELVQSIQVTNVNEASLEIFAAESKAQLMESLVKTFGDDAMDIFIDSVCALWEGEETYISKANYVDLKGNKIIGQISIALPMTHHQSMSVPVVIEDITKKEQAQTQLKLLASVFTEAKEGICIVSADNQIIEVNDAFSTITGYERDEVVGKSPNVLQSGRHDKAFYDAMWGTLNKHDSWQGEIWNRKKDGSIYPQMLSISAVRDDQGKLQNYLALFSDISEIKAHEEELKHLAQYDALTGLSNRVLFADRMRQAIAVADRNKQSLAVAYIDLDGFKTVNDTYGHNIGDDLLVAVAERMSKTIRSIDSLARIGGDEFVAIFTQVEQHNSIDVLTKRLLDAVSKPFEINDISISISASIGISLYPQAEKVDGDQLQRQADQAMYEAKLAGRNVVRYFDSAQDSAIAKKFSLLKEIKVALDEDQFEMFYQPKLNLVSGEVIGVEALIRWNHPEIGLCPPNQFLPQIENDLISVEVGDWVIDAVFNQITAWQSSQINLPVSINVSALQMEQADFADKLARKLKEYPNIAPSQIELEILETSSIEDLDKAALVIEKVKALGLGFAIDDFGSGYASLIYLKKLRVETLKIDQELVRTMLDNVDDTTILRGVLALADNFEMKALAEGVETLQHVKLLADLGCVYGQGYAMSKPLPADKFVIWLNTWKPSADWYLTDGRETQT